MHWVLIAFVGLLVVTTIVLLPHNLRAWNARRTYRRLDQQTIDQVLSALDEATESAVYETVTFLRHMPDAVCNDPTVSHIGGLPYAERHDEWPTTRSGPDTFLVQVRLDDPSLSEVWQGRLVQVFLVHDMEQTVRSYGQATRKSHRPMKAPDELLDCVPLRHVRVPKHQVADDRDWSDELIDVVPQIRRILGPSTNDVEGLVTQILSPGCFGYHLDSPDVAFIGDEPILIQNSHGPICEQCGKRMRFLFQFGENVLRLRIADGAVCYVYGCDDHPDNCKGFIDSH